MLQKASVYISLIVAAFLLLSSIPSQAQESDKVWAVGMNYHKLLEPVADDIPAFEGLNITFEKRISNRFSATISGTYFVRQDINRSIPFLREDYTRTGGYFGVHLIGDIFSVKVLTLYGKIGVNHFINRYRGEGTYFSDIGPPPLNKTIDYNFTDNHTGYDFGFGFEINYKAIFFIEVSSAQKFTEIGTIGDIQTGIKVPF